MKLLQVSNGEVPKITVSLLIKPFVNYIATVRDRRLTTSISQNIFFYLLKQSDMGREYQEKYEIWKQAGCPTSNPEDIEIEEEIDDEKVSEEDEGVGDEEDVDEDVGSGTDETPFDPRAGDVNVDIPEIEFRPQGIIAMFEKIMFKQFVYRKNINCIKGIIFKYKRFISGVYPFALRNVPMVSEISKELPDLDKKAKELDKFYLDMHKNSKEYKKAYKKSKRMSKEKGIEYLKSIEEKLSQAQELQNENTTESLNQRETNDDSENFEMNNKTCANKKLAKKRRLTGSLKSESDTEKYTSKKLKANLSKKQKLAESKEDISKSPKIFKDNSDLTRRSLRKSINANSDFCEENVIPVESTISTKKIKVPTPNKSAIKTKTLKLKENDNSLNVEKGSKISPKIKTPVQTMFIVNEDSTLSPISSTPQTRRRKNSTNFFDLSDEWSQPLQDGEVEFFLPSRKAKLAEVNKSLTKEFSPPATPIIKMTRSSSKGNLSPSRETEILITPKKMFLPNPFAKQSLTSTKKLGDKTQKFLNQSDPGTGKFPESSEKRVKIALYKNVSQETDEYIKTLENSPQVPYDSSRKPIKGLLKPNSMPSPINPFYMKKIGLNFNNSIV